MKERLKAELEFLEYNAHRNAYTPLGTFYWESFLIKEASYNAKFNEKYQRRW